MASLVFICIVGTLKAQFTGDVLGSHDLSPSGQSPVKGGMSAPCLYCHAPHSGVGGTTPLWSQTLSSQTYTLYSSSTEQNISTEPTVGGPSSLCLSCHDGTIAPGETVPYGQVTMTGSMNSTDVFGAALKSSHPFSLKTPLVDSPDLVDSLVSTGKTADSTGAVALINGNVECTSCHNPHVQNIDRVSLNFLSINSSNGAMCLACHDVNGRTVGGQTNPLMGWSNSIHAFSANVVNSQAQIGSYTTVAQFACISCHTPHNASGPAGLLRAPNPALTNVDSSAQNCATCHSGGSNLQSPLTNVFAEFDKSGHHPFPAGSNVHDPTEPAVLVNNRHATCVDCHNSHSSLQTAVFSAPPGIRLSQNNVVGVSASDGTTVLTPAVNQFENCLRCHGTSPGKQALSQFGYTPAREVNAPDPLNVIPQFALSATSSHPVTHDSTSTQSQPSLRTYMLNLDGVSNSQRTIGTRIFCTDCHNSDDNREFGGAGPNGPHGSTYSHVLERRYEFSQAPAPGQPITNPFPNPDLSVSGPYALCAKCHDLSIVLSPTSPFSQHQAHVVQDGISCSVCHTAHGLGGTSANISGERLLNFDVNVVAPNGSVGPTYNQSTKTCTLTCHGVAHSNSSY